MLDNGAQLSQWRLTPAANHGFNVPDPMSGQSGSAEDDAFLWSLADLMTLLLIFFVLLYANAIQLPNSAARETESVNTAVVSSPIIAADHFPEQPARESASPQTTQVPEQSPPTPKPGLPVTDEPIEPLNREIVDSLKDSFSNDFYVRWDEKQPVFVLGERITFNVGDAMLLAEAQSALKRIADLIASQGDYQVIVSGHTDNVAIRTPIFPSNWELSAARAASVAKYLASHGVDPQRLLIQGKSEFHPLVANTSARNRKTNRRVEISLLKSEQTVDTSPF